jgi:hypothetical protein
MIQGNKKAPHSVVLLCLWQPQNIKKPLKITLAVTLSKHYIEKTSICQPQNQIF